MSNETKIPEQDSGEALVGRMCWVWDRYPRIALLRQITAYRIDSRFPYATNRTRWTHARPEKLGYPDNTPRLTACEKALRNIAAITTDPLIQAECRKALGGA